MIRRPPRSTHCISSAASDVYKRQVYNFLLKFNERKDLQSVTVNWKSCNRYQSLYLAIQGQYWYCVPCHQSCQVCSAGTQYDCIVCANGYKFQGNVCVKTSFLQNTILNKQEAQ
eukprot:TRINITY_DN8797_c0_g1_i8.p2 TRINITY_DN8797_c0_g1~~TRINITY_DN8797_c0_g1_i8.p2  ORF type:complete len:114 (+),score=24.20 TRINITY_DN8797_c0_g1_i8:129-470(+)